MKVAFFTERLLLGFGVDLTVYQLANGLAKKGFSIDIWTILWDRATYPERKNLRIREVAIRRPAFYPLYEFGAFQRFRFLAKSAADAELWILTSLPFFSYAWLMKKFVRRPARRSVPRVWVMEFGLPPSTGMPLLQKFNFAFMRWTQRHLYFPAAERVIAISHFLREGLPDEIRDMAEVIHLGADHYSPTQEGLREELGIAPDEVLFVYVGRLDPIRQPYKGVEPLIRMFQAAQKKALNPIRLALVGTGPDDGIQRLSASDVLVLRDFPASRMGALLLSADVVICASYWEGFNLPIAEAQAFGKPVLCYAVGAHPEVVREDATGFLARSEKDFINYICVLANDPSLRSKMGREAHAWASRFRWRFSVDKLYTLIQESVGAPTPAHPQKSP